MMDDCRIERLILNRTSTAKGDHTSLHSSLSYQHAVVTRVEDILCDGRSHHGDAMKNMESCQPSQDHMRVGTLDWQIPLRHSPFTKAKAKGLEQRVETKSVHVVAGGRR